MPLDIREVNRPITEIYDVFVKVTDGCSHGKCIYCPFFKEPYRRLSVQEIEEEAVWAKGWCEDQGEEPKRAFLQGADAFSQPFETLMAAAEYIYREMPWVKSIGSYARVDNFRDKTVDQIRQLKEAGYSDIYVGIESGDPRILKRNKKGYTPEDIREQMQKLDEAGMVWTGNFLNGLGGHRYGDKHARLTAALYKDLKPVSIEVMSLTLMEGTKLYKKGMRGSFQEATEEERLEELWVFLTCLENETVIRCRNVSNAVKLAGRLPRDKQKLLDEIDRALEKGVDFDRERIRKL